MGNVQPLPRTPEHRDAPVRPQIAAVRPIESARCALCGKPLSARALRYRVVPPQSAETTITVCHTCHKAALGEGYRPAE